MIGFEIKFFIFISVFLIQFVTSRKIGQREKLFSNKNFYPNAHMQLAYKVKRITSMPYAAIIDIFQVKKGIPESSLCSGVIVAKQVVLSAAHCFSQCRKQRIAPADVRIRIGCKRLSVSAEPNECEDYKPKKIVTPKEWEGGKGLPGSRKCNTLISDYQYDIAVLILDKPINSVLFARGRAAIAKLPEPTTGLNNPVTVAGYGERDNFIDGSLYAAWVNTYTQAECLSLWRVRYNYTMHLTNGNTVFMGNKKFYLDLVCINYTTRMCSGDSGGPMLECGAQTCFPYCLLPDCPNATIIGIHTYSHLGCTEDPAPIYPRVLDPEDETDRETKVAGYFIDVRIHVAWIKQMITANGVTFNLRRPPKKRNKGQKQHNVKKIKHKSRKG